MRLMAEDEDDIFSIQDLFEKVNKQLKEINGKLETLEKDVAFIKQKSDQIGIKVYWLDKKMDDIKKQIAP